MNGRLGSYSGLDGVYNKSLGCVGVCPGPLPLAPSSKREGEPGLDARHALAPFPAPGRGWGSGQLRANGSQWGELSL